ncbi:MAG: polysaccharide biosynthesis/export family protein [Candidatus Jettenia sp. CY-1]|nr:MAG: polysaccharide biosynthesis/export family protein [Candidatus Jettenia sp. CY-1]
MKCISIIIVLRIIEPLVYAPISSFFSKMHKKYLLLLILSCILYSCSSNHYTKKTGSNNHSLHENPSKIQIAEGKIENQSEKNQFDYCITGKDILYITVYNEPELSYDRQTNRSLRVSVDGKITFPLLGETKVAGLTPFQLEKKLEQLLSNGYLINPHVSVIVGDYYGSVCVIGQVKQPRQINLVDRNITIIEAISMAGGFTDIASPDRTHIIRMEDNVEKKIPIKVNKIMRGEKSKDIILKPDDIVVVPEAFF